jgi:hypothetical protein
MNATRVTCPSCKAHLNVPAGCEGKLVRCPRCQAQFRVAQKAPVGVDDIVASWLTEGESEDREQPEARAGNLDPELEDHLSMLEEAQRAAPREPLAGRSGGIRIVKIDRNGVLFEFPASRLLEPAFRCGFPRQCICCDTRLHLRAHVVMFAAEFRESVSLAAERATGGGLALSNEEVKDLSDEEVLRRLPNVPNAPSPADLPLAYWVCDLCSARGMVSGQIHVNPGTGKGWCRLWVGNRRQALDFMSAAGGEDTKGCRILKERIEKTADNPWDRIPRVVQHRIEQWYHAKHGERLLAYIPDRDHARTEDGMAGLIVTNTRVIYHTPVAHREATIDQPLELQQSMAGRKGHVHIKAPAWEVQHFTVDRDGLAHMHRALTLGRFPARWD